RTLSVNVFEVIADSSVPVPLRLMYCKPPTEAERLQGIKPDDPTDKAFWTRRRIQQKAITETDFRPDGAVTDLKEGMIFKAGLQTQDDTAKAQNASSRP